MLRRTWLRSERASNRQLNRQNRVGVPMAYTVTASIERAHIIRRRTRRATTCASKLWLLRAYLLLLLWWLSNTSCKLRLLWCLRNLLLAHLLLAHLLLAHLLLRHARMPSSSWVRPWVRTRAGRAICLLGSGLVLYGCASRGWEVLLLRVVWWRRVLGLASAGRWWVVLLLLLVRGRGRRRWWVGLAAWRRRVVLLLALLICRVSVLKSGTKEVKPKNTQEVTYHNHPFRAGLLLVSYIRIVFSMRLTRIEVSSRWWWVVS
jgi:hypothetical protein